MTIILTASIGSYLLLVSHADTASSSIEAEKGTVNGSANLVTDTDASGGRAVRFNASPNSNPTGNFYIVGKDIIDPTGHKFYPVGGNVGVKLNFDWAGVADGQSDSAVAWGWNTVRLNMQCSTKASWSTSRERFGYPYFMNQIDRIVKEYTAKHIVVMVACHDYTGGDGLDMTTMPAPGQLPPPDDTAHGSTHVAATDQQYVSQIDEFWHDMAVKYKANPYVWFNGLNEFGTFNVPNWLAANQRYLNVVRSAGAENIFVSDVLVTGNDSGRNGTPKVYDPGVGDALNAGQCNVLFSMHNYGGLVSASFNSQSQPLVNEAPFRTYWQNVQAANLPMIIGEVGLNYNASFQRQNDGSIVILNDTKTNPPEAPWYHHAEGEYATFHDAPGFGIGVLAWHTTFTGDNILATPHEGVILPGDSTASKPNFYNILNTTQTGTGNGFTFTTLGQDLWNLGHNKPDLGVFTGNYAASNCASAQ